MPTMKQTFQSPGPKELTDLSPKTCGQVEGADTEIVGQLGEHDYYEDSDYVYGESREMADMDFVVRKRDGKIFYRDDSDDQWRSEDRESMSSAAIQRLLDSGSDSEVEDL